MWEKTVVIESGGCNVPFVINSDGIVGIDIYDQQTIETFEYHWHVVADALQTARVYLSANIDEMNLVYHAESIPNGVAYVSGYRHDKDEISLAKLEIIANSEFASEGTRAVARTMIDNINHKGARINHAKQTRSGMTKARAQILRAVAERDGYVCRKCGATKDLHIDHIVPVACGGTNDLDNLQFLCRSCNMAKGASNGE